LDAFQHLLAQDLRKLWFGEQALGQITTGDIRQPFFRKVFILLLNLPVFDISERIINIQLTNTHKYSEIFALKSFMASPGQKSLDGV
jgi:hypothetical protein